MRDNLYKMVQEDIKAKIEMGVFGHNQKLPSEDELCEIYAVSKVTLRKSLSLLIDQGYLQAKSRVGYFVTVPENSHFILQYDAESGCADTIDHREVARVSVIEQPLAHHPRTHRIEVVRRFYSGGLPVALETRSVWVRHSVPAGRDNALLQYQEQVFANIHHYTQHKKMKIRALTGSPEVCAFLDAFEDDPLLGVDIQYFDKYNALFAATETYYASESGLLQAAVER